MKEFISILFFLIVSNGIAQLSFINSATSQGVGVTYGSSSFGGGVSFCDFDNDGWDDITYATTDGEEVYFFKNNNGVFSQIDLGINDVYRTSQVIWIDYDSDGDKDFFATSKSGFNKFYRNEGNLVFTDITSTCGLFTDNFLTNGASFGDIDNDGDLDVFISNRDDIDPKDQYSYLYRNNNGIFEEITATANIYLGNQLSFCSAFFDYNNDGFQDIYVANDKSPNINRLYKNNNGDGTFTDVSIASGAGIAIDAMSTTIGDYNNDGWFDIYVTNTSGGNHHLKNNGDGTFTDMASALGTGFYSIAWGAVFLDADNDADLDLYVSSSVFGSDPRLTSAFYENQGNDTYLIPTNIGFDDDKLRSFSNAIGDFNNDGLPDIIVMNDTENNFLWENTTINSNNWLKIKLQGVTSNRDGIGSKIECFANGKVQYRYTLNGEGYIGQNSNTEFIGLGSATTIDYIKVTWLSGTVDLLSDVDVNQSILIVEGENILSNSDFTKISFNIYPNPSTAIFNIELPHFSSDELLNVYDIFGRKLKTKSLDSQKTTINLKEFSEGVYFFKLQSDLGTSIKKVIIKKN